MTVHVSRRFWGRRHRWLIRGRQTGWGTCCQRTNQNRSANKLGLFVVARLYFVIPIALAVMIARFGRKIAAIPIALTPSVAIRKMVCSFCTRPRPVYIFLFSEVSFFSLLLYIYQLTISTEFHVEPDFSLPFVQLVKRSHEKVLSIFQLLTIVHYEAYIVLYSWYKTDHIHKWSALHSPIAGLLMQS